MINKNTSSFQSPFFFNACMNQPNHNSQLKLLRHKPNLKNLKNIHSSKTLGKPLSLQDLHLNKKTKPTKNTQLCSPFQQILKPSNQQPKLLTPSLTNSFYVAQNPSPQYDNLAQSQQSRKSRYQGNKIKIFSNNNSKGNIRILEDRGKSVSRQSHGTSGSKQKRGIQMTKNLLKKISGMYSTQDFSKGSQPASNRTSLYQRIQTLQKESFQNQTGLLMTTWDSQRTTEEYQLSREYDSMNNNTTRDNFGLVSYGTMNVLNSSYESNRMGEGMQKNSFNYSMNKIAEYSMRHEGGQQGNGFGESRGKQQVSFSTLNSAKKIQNAILAKQQGVPLPVEYQQSNQRPSYHLSIKPSENTQRRPVSSISKGKLVSKTSHSKIFSSSNQPSSSQQKNSLLFSKRKQFQKMKTNVPSKHVLFQTAHQILSEQVSSIRQPYQLGLPAKEISGEQLTNMLYGNKEVAFKKDQCQVQDKDKYLVKYKNKTLDDLSVKQSMIEGYDNYYQ